MAARIVVEIVNKKGLHARAAAKFVKVASSFNAQAQVMKEGESTWVTASSILGLMMLGADPGSKLHISAEGQDAEKMIAALKELIESKFGEGE